jgi:hypothetical protein
VAQDYIILPGGVHVWGPSRKSLGQIPADIIAKKSSSYAIHDYPQRRGWKRIATDSMMVQGNVPEDALKAITVTAEKLDEMLENYLGGPKRRYIYTILVFESREAFCKFATSCGAGTAHSLYNPLTREIAVHFGETVTPEEFLETYAHEFTHAFMDIIYGVTEPLWFAEGMAEYFSRIKWTKSGFRPTGTNWKAAMHLDVDDLIPLQAILTGTREEIYGHQFSQYYGQCWGLVHFLLHKHPEIVDGLLRRESFDISLLSNEYRTYLRKLMGA